MARSAPKAIVAFTVVAVVGATASAAPPVRLFPGVARIAGANNTAWRASAVLNNPTAATQSVVLELLPRDGSTVAASQSISLAPGETREIANLYDFLGAADGAGMLRVTGSVASWVRSYNEGTGTFGQDLPAVVPGVGFSALEGRVFPLSTPADIKSDFRSNLMLVNLDAADITVTMIAGAVAATKTVPAGAYVQINNLGKFLGLPAGFAAVKVSADGPWFGAISTIDPFTGDPTTIRGLSASDVGERSFPAIAQKAGANGAAWRSEAVFFNPSVAVVPMQLDLIPRGGSAIAATATLTLAPGETRRIANLYDFLGVAEGAGTLHVTGGALAWVRTYNQRSHPGDTAMETFGQDLPPVGSENVIAPGAFVVLPFQTPADVWSGFRSNLVLLNLEDHDITVSLRAGGITRSQIVPAASYVQIDKIGAFLGVPVGVSCVWATADGRWSTAISTIDPATNDPTTFRAIEGLQPPSSADLIDQALTSGAINSEQALTYRVFAEFNDPRLPAQFTGDDRAVVEPDAVQEASLSFSTLSPGTQDVIGPFLVPAYFKGSWWDLRHGASGVTTARGAAGTPCRPWLTFCGILTGYWDYVTGAHVRVWYMTSQAGTDRAIADDLVSQAEFHIWGQLLTVTGTQAIPYDLGDGQPRVDIELVDSMDGWPTALGVTIPYGGTCRKAAAHIQIKRTISSIKMRRATLAHELMHAFQYAFNTDCSNFRWLREATAEWFEDVAYQSYNTEHFDAPKYLDTTKLSLDDTSVKNREYSAYLFFFYLNRVRGLPETVVGDIWRATETMDALHAVDSGIKKNGTDLDTVWPEFAVYNLNEKPFDDYRTKDKLPFFAKLQRNSDMSVPFRDGFVQFAGKSDCELPHLSIRYFRFNVADTTLSAVAFLNGLKRALEKTTIEDYGEVYTAKPVGAEATKGAHVDALFLVNGQWKREAWTDVGANAYCLDVKKERFDSLIVILSNSDISTSRTLKPPGTYPPGLLVSNVGCASWEGNADLTNTYNIGPIITERMTVSGIRLNARVDGFWDDGTPVFRAFDTAAGTFSWSAAGASKSCTYKGQLSNYPVANPLNAFHTVPWLTSWEERHGLICLLFYEWLMPLATIKETCPTGSSEDRWKASEFFLGVRPKDTWARISDDGKTIRIDASKIPNHEGLSGTWELHAKREP